MNRLKSLFKNRIFKSIALITGGTGIAQLINLLLQPVITRIYSPEEYGVLTLYIAVLGSVTIITSLKYELAIPIADNDKKAFNILIISFIILCLLVALITVILVFLPGYIYNKLNMGTLYKYRLLIPLGIFLIGLYNIIVQWAFRKKDYLSISKTKVNQSIYSNTTKIAIGLLGFGPIGLILGHIIGASAGIATLSRSLFAKQRQLFKNIHKNKLKWGFKRYKRFPIYLAPSQFLNSAGLQLPILFLTSIHGAKVVGFYGIATAVVNLPMGLVGNSVGDVFYGEAASIGKDNPRRIKNLSSNLIKRLFFIGLIPTIILLLFAPVLFSLVFGEKWYEAGLYARIISVLVLFRLVFTPVSRVFTIYEEQKKALFLDSLRVILVILSFTISIILSLNPFWTISLYSLSMSFIYVITYFMAQKILDNRIAKKFNLT